MRSKEAEEAVLATLKPQSPVDIRRGVSFRRTSGGIAVVRLHYSAKADRDPERNPDWLPKERRKYTSQAAWDREQEIVDEAGGGELVFADTLVTWWKKIVISDPRWRPDPDWRVEGGFDHGKTNATALLRAYHDFDGTIYFAGEYYQPGKEIWQHAPAMRKMIDLDKMETRFADPTIFDITSQQSQRPGQAAERAKSFAELYAEQGLEFSPFRGDRSDVSFAGRLMTHWADLEHREPTAKILCPEGLYSDSPQFGLHQWACPNLLWELMRTRRVKLTAQQLLSRNVSEAIVDKDNHTRDAMKYILMSYPQPSEKSALREVNERVLAAAQESQRTGDTISPALLAHQLKLAQAEQRRIRMDDQDADPSPRLTARQRIRRHRRRWRDASR